MSILRKLLSAIFGSSSAPIRDPEGIYLYVKCRKCGAPVRIRADRRNDLLRDFDTGGFTLNKEVMDGTCFSLMYATVRFDAAYQILSQEIQGGDFISEAEFEALAARRSQPDSAA